VSMEAQHTQVSGHPLSFSQHHLGWLYRNGFIPDLPLELGPFPLVPDQVAAEALEEHLRKQLIEWGVVSEGLLNPEAKFLFESLLGIGVTWTVWGTVLLHSLKTNDRAEFDPEGIDEWGLKHAVRDVPRVHFMICVTPKEIITVLNAPPNLIMNRVPIKGPNLALQVGVILKSMLDPQQRWTPWPGPSLSAPMSVITKLVEIPEASRLDLDAEDATKRPDVVKRALRELEMSNKTSEALAELSSYPTTAVAQVSINFPTPSGWVTPPVSMGVSFLDGAGVMVSYPAGKTEQTRTLYYVPGNDEGFENGIRSLTEAARSASSS